MNVKKIMKVLFPNILDTCSLEIEKKRNYAIIHKVQKAGEDNYPEMLKCLYKKRTGHQLDLDNPIRLTEKIQWRKIYDRNPVYSILSDKYKVREWVKKKIGEEYLIPIIGVWEHFRDIDFQSLPEQFVLKTNNASHTNIIVTDKKTFTRQKWSAGRRMEYWLQAPFSYLEGLELHYRAIKPMIIAEKYIQPEEGKRELVDFKFHCFNGKPILCQVIGDRSDAETIDFFDSNWKHVALSRPPFPNAQKTREKPATYALMIELASKLSEGFSYVRIDMYEHNKKVLFGEMTFTPASGMMKFEPDRWDYILGELWDINSEQVDQNIVQL